MVEVTGGIAIEGGEAVVFPHFLRGGPLSWIGLIGGLMRPTFLECLLQMRRFILTTKYSERLKTMQKRLKGKSEFKLMILFYIYLGQTSDGRRE